MNLKHRTYAAPPHPLHPLPPWQVYVVRPVTTFRTVGICTASLAEQCLVVVARPHIGGG